jgi:hypothetical protein
MKLANRYSGIFLLLLVFTFLLTSTLCFALDYSEFIVKNLKVTDIEDDDGSGLMVSWEPLPVDRRIIEYRVYRGTTPDSLFFVQKIDVNVKTGVAGDEMYFYDKDFNYFLDIQAPRKLKKAKGQPKDSNLYYYYPRDLNVSGPQLKNYTILGVINEKNFYYKSQKVEVQKGDETKVYAGLKIRHLSMYKKLTADKEYYYTVSAVNEAGRSFPPAEPAIGIPRENSPEKPQDLSVVYVNDLNQLQLERSLPIFKDDIYYHSVYALLSKDIPVFEEYVRQLELKEANDLARKTDDTIEEYKITQENPSKMIFRRQSAYPYTSMNTAVVNIENGLIKDEKMKIETQFDVDKLNDYVFVFSLFDYAGYETFSDVKELHSNMSSADLPMLPMFKVTDRENDKGDYNLVYWGKPVVYLTNTSFLNEAKTKLLVNYEFVTNKEYKVRNIYFRVFDETGKQIAYVNEFYQDRRIVIKIPAGTKKLSVEMTFKCNHELPGDYLFKQNLVHNEFSYSLEPKAVFMNNEEIDKFNYKVYKRNITESEYRLIRNNSGTQRELDDFVRYTNDHFPLVAEFDAEKQMVLVSADFSVTKDVEKDATIRTSLFLSEAVKGLEKNQTELIKYQTKKDSLITAGAANIEQFDAYIEHYQKQVDLIQSNPILQEANSISVHKARLKYLHKVRQDARRGFEYFLVKSDGKAAFRETPIFVNESGVNFITPIPNWFKMDMMLSLIATLIFALLVYIMIHKAKQGHDLFIRPIAGISEIDNAIGRATEMGKPILFVPGLSGISDVATLAGLSILGRVAKKAAEYDTRILVPVRDPIVLPIAQEIVKEAHYEAGRPDSYDKNSVFFITTAQFAFVAGVNGVMIREKTATNFYMGMFWAEALIMTETGSSTGAIQISGTDAITQIPFFITTCDYTLIGEELYAASAYLAREPLMLGTLKAQDYTKFLIIVFIVLGSLLSTAHLTFFINSFPEK